MSNKNITPVKHPIKTKDASLPDQKKKKRSVGTSFPQEFNMEEMP